MATKSTQRVLMLSVALAAAVGIALGVGRQPTAAIAPNSPSETVAPDTDAPVTDAPVEAHGRSGAAAATPGPGEATSTGPLVTPPGHFYVDADRGDDTNPGTIEAPFATLERARAAARAAIRDAADDVVVNIVGSVPLAETFVLTSEDSGRAGAAMVYRAAPGDVAVIEGGVELSGWEEAGGGVYQVRIPDDVDGLRQFYANGERQPRARSPEATGTALRFTKEQILGSARDHSIVVDSDVVSGFAHPEDLELVYIGVHIAGHGVTDEDGREVLRPSWRAHRLPVEAAVDRSDGTTRLDIVGDALYHATERGFWKTFLIPSDPFYLENARELLDTPGEWFFDPRERVLSWMPPRGVVPDAVDTWIPRVETLLDVTGTPSEPVTDVRIEGITFRHSTYLVPDVEGYASGQGAAWFAGWEPDDWMDAEDLRHPYLERPIPQGLPGAAVEVDSAHRIEFAGNTFTALGAAGVLLHNDVADAVFADNTFRDISGSGFIAGHEVHDDLDHPLERVIARVRFENNAVSEIGREYYTGLGIKVFKAKDFVIANNHFSDIAYSAVSVGWGWARNPDSDVHANITIEHNRFANVVNTLYDGAAIYLLGPTAGWNAPLEDHTVVRGNFIDFSGARAQLKLPGDGIEPTYAKRPGIQLDEGNRNLLIEDNVVIGASVWLQVTEWPVKGGDASWRRSLNFAGTGNWANGLASVPANLNRVGFAPATTFAVSAGIVPEVATIRKLSGIKASKADGADIGRATTEHKARLR